MANFYAKYDSASGSSANASVGANGVTAPTSSTEVAGINPGGNLQPLQTTATGALITESSGVGPAQHVIVDSSALPAGASTSANQVTIITDLDSIDSNTSAISSNTQNINNKLGTLGQKAMTGSAPVVIASDQSAIPVSAAALPLPSGASTSALQTTGNTSLASIDTKTPALVSGSVPVHVDNFPATQPVSGSVTVTQATGTNLHTVVDSSALPSGASTSSLQTTGNTSLASIDGKMASLGQKAMSGSMPVAIASDQSSIPTKITTNAAGTVTQAAITVGTTAVRLTVSGSAPAATRQQLMVIVDSASTAKFYIGSSSVTSTSTTRGIQILAGMPFVVSNDAGDYYIISDTAAQTVYVLEQA